jgi:hypothetical protein
LEGGNNQENSTSVTMLGDRGPHDDMKNGFLSQRGGEPEERLMVD